MDWSRRREKSKSVSIKSATGNRKKGVSRLTAVLRVDDELLAVNRVRVGRVDVLVHTSRARASEQTSVLCGSRPKRCQQSKETRDVIRSDRCADRRRSS